MFILTIEPDTSEPVESWVHKLLLSVAERIRLGERIGVIRDAEGTSVGSFRFNDLKIVEIESS